MRSPSRNRVGITSVEGSNPMSWALFGQEASPEEKGRDFEW